MSPRERMSKDTVRELIAHQIFACDYYALKGVDKTDTDKLLSQLAEVVFEEARIMVKKYAGTQVGNCVPLLEFRDHIANLFKPEEVK